MQSDRCTKFGSSVNVNHRGAVRWKALKALLQNDGMSLVPAECRLCTPRGAMVDTLYFHRNPLGEFPKMCRDPRLRCRNGLVVLFKRFLCWRRSFPFGQVADGIR